MKETTIKRSYSSIWLLLQLLLSHILAGGLALLVSSSNFLAILNSGNNPNGWVRLVVALVVAGIVGLLSSLNLQLGLQALAIKLDQLTETLTCSPLTSLERSRWLLPDGLLTKTSLLSIRLVKLAQKERGFNELKESWQLEASHATEQKARQNLAARLHDTLKQQVHFISIAAATAQLKLENDLAGAKLALAEVRRYAREAVKQADTLIKELEPQPPSYAQDLLQVIAEESRKVENYSGVEVIQDLPEVLEIAPAIQAGLARVVQLAVANIIRHAHASQVRFMVRLTDKTLSLEISDNGNGFDVAGTPGNTGLANSRLEVFKLGGELTIVSQSGAGTSLLVKVPLLDHLERSYRSSATGIFKQWSQQVTNCYTLSGLALEFLLLSGGLFGRVLNQKQQSITPWSEWMLLGLLFLMLLGFIFCLYSFYQGWDLSHHSKIDLASTNTPSARAWKRRNLFYLLASLTLFPSAFLPLLVLRFPLWPALDYIGGADHGIGDGTGWVLVALGSSFFFGLVTLVAIGQVYRYNRRYYKQLWPSELEYEINLAWRLHQFQLKNSLWIGVVSAIYLLGIGFAMPPTVWQWLVVYSLTVFACLIVYELVKRRFLIKAKQELELAQGQGETREETSSKEEFVRAKS